jgi:hypothetical protein
MDRQEIQFMTIADANYFKSVRISARQIKKFYPESTLNIYDWGLNKLQKKELTEVGNVTLHEWKFAFPPLSSSFGKWNLLQEIKHKIKSILNFLRGEKFEFSFGSETYFFNKHLCIKDFNTKIKKPFAFLDGDAFLINNVDDLLNQDLDIAVTRRKKGEIDYSFNNCQVINTGVIFFLGNYSTNKDLIENWSNELLKTKEYLAEQTALTRLLKNKKEKIFETTPSSHTLNFSEVEIKVGILPCEVYNYNWIKDFKSDKNRKVIKILHFKSGRFNTDLFRKIAHKLDL